MDVMERIRWVRESGLTELDLSEMMLDEIPAEVFENEKLTSLNIGWNGIRELPKEIIELKNLTSLDISFNEISELPKEIIELKNLVNLDISGNRISELPKEIANLNKLRELYVQNNPLVTPPIEITNQGIEAIKNYFTTMEKDTSEKLYEAKLIIVGQGEVGKTCLAKKIQDNDYQINSNELTTEGIDIINWKYDCGIKGNEIEFNTNIWDFGGQEIYHATHQFFLTKRSLYIFVWDARKDEDQSNIDYWLNVVKLLSNSSPVLIVLNKCEGRIKGLDERSLLQRFENIKGFYKVSCQTGEGIESLTRDIKKAMIELPHVGTEWPKVWTTIRKRLENDERDYIDYKEYKQICNEYGLDEEKAKFLSAYLHDLGDILHFQEDPILKNIVILKPDWGTNAVYKVLDTKSIQENGGMFEFKALEQIWGDSKYPPEKHIELLRLMIKFELCFKLADEESYIVPELLPYDKPDLGWDGNNNLKFEYRYEFMPAGIITRFIVRAHGLIENSLYWKNGVVLNHEGTRALVESDYYSRKITININGADRKELLYLIRREFAAIHKSLNNPDLKEMVPCICEDCKKSRTPYFFEYKTLKRFEKKGKPTIECQLSADDVPLKQLLSGIEEYGTEEILMKEDGYRNSTNYKDYVAMSRVDTHPNTIHIYNEKVYNIANSTITFNEVSETLLEFINKQAENEAEKKELSQCIEIIKTLDTTTAKKLSAFEKVKGFFTRHGANITDSLVASGLYTLLQQNVALDQTQILTLLHEIAKIIPHIPK